MSVDFDRGSPGKFDSRTLNRETLDRGIGRIHESCFCILVLLFLSSCFLLYVLLLCCVLFLFASMCCTVIVVSTHNRRLQSLLEGGPAEGVPCNSIPLLFVQCSFYMTCVCPVLF